MPATHATYDTACGGRIRVPRSFHSHQAAHPVAAAHLAEAIAAIRLPRKGNLATEVDLGREIGVSQRVPAEKVALDGGILAARRIGRPFPSRVVVGVEPPPTSWVVLVTGRDHLREPVLVTAFYGRVAPPEPLGRTCANVGGERDRSLEFWTGEALVWTRGLYMESPFPTTWDRMVRGLWRQDLRLPRPAPDPDAMDDAPSGPSPGAP